MKSELTKPEQEALLTLALLAANADGGGSDVERAEVKRIATSFTDGDLNPAAIHQRVVLRQVGIADAVVPLAVAAPEVRQLAYEIAVGVCEADDQFNEREKAFLAELQRSLRLDPRVVSEFHQQADAVALAPLAGPSGLPATGPAPAGAVPPVLGGRVADAEVDRIVLQASILNGALELLPESLATMAIVPLQMRLVYKIGQLHGFELDRGHITELLGAAGVGLSSQVLEGFAQKLIGGLLGKLAGGLGRGLGRQVTSSAMSFASTYALGQLAHRYYGGGRRLSSVQLRELFSSLTGQARELHGRYAGEIQARAGQINPSQLLNLVRG